MSKKKIDRVQRFAPGSTQINLSGRKRVIISIAYVRPPWVLRIVENKFKMIIICGVRVSIYTRSGDICIRPTNHGQRSQKRRHSLFYPRYCNNN